MRARRPGPILDRDHYFQPCSKDSAGCEEGDSSGACRRGSGREPKFKQAASTEFLRLPAQSATMDDCCRILEVLLGAPPSGQMSLTLGILEIISTVELAVTALYTASNGAGCAPSIDVEQIAPRLRVIYARAGNEGQAVFLTARQLPLSGVRKG